MAFTQPSVVTNNIAALNPEPNDVGGLTAAQLQAKYDQFGVDFQTWFKNTHLAELASIVLGSSASEYLGSATIAGLTGNTIYAQLVSLLAVAQAAQAGAILPGTITDTMLSNLAGQIKDTITKHLVDYVKQVPYAADTGAANAYVVTLSPAPTAYVDGMGVAVKIGNASTGASTLNVNALGAKPILDTLGNALTATNNLKSGLIYSFRYNATTGNFILQGKGGGGNATAGHLLLGDIATVDSGQITGTMPSKLAENLGTLGATLLNLITNGSFENGLVGWTFTGTQPTLDTAIKKFGSQSAKFVINSVQTNSYTDVVNVIGHKIYFGLWGYITNSTYSPQIYLADYGTFVNAIGAALDKTVLSQWQLKSAVRTLTTNGYRQVLDITSSTDTATVNFDGLFAIDLTAAFGAGLEPTQVQMDAIMTALGGWFDGNSILTKIASGGYLNNGALGTPEVLLNDPNHIAANIVSGITDFGVTGTAKKLVTGTVIGASGGVFTVTGLPFSPTKVHLYPVVSVTNYTHAVNLSSTKDIPGLNALQYGATVSYLNGTGSVGDVLSNPMTANGFSFTNANLGTITMNYSAEG